MSMVSAKEIAIGLANTAKMLKYYTMSNNERKRNNLPMRRKKNKKKNRKKDQILFTFQNGKGIKWKNK